MARPRKHLGVGMSQVYKVFCDLQFDSLEKLITSEEYLNNRRGDNSRKIAMKNINCALIIMYKQLK